MKRKILRCAQNDGERGFSFAIVLPGFMSNSKGVAGRVFDELELPTCRLLIINVLRLSLYAYGLPRLRGSKTGGRFLWRSALRAIQRNRPPVSLPGFYLKALTNLLALPCTLLIVHCQLSIVYLSAAKILINPLRRSPIHPLHPRQILQGGLFDGGDVAEGFEEGAASCGAYSFDLIQQRMEAGLAAYLPVVG